MSLIQHKIKSCCGSNSFVFEVNKPIKKNHLQKFKDAGYSVPQNFAIAGVFYVCMNNLIATSSFGSTKIQVKCHGNCKQIMDNFGKLLDEVVNS